MTTASTRNKHNNTTWQERNRERSADVAFLGGMKEMRERAFPARKSFARAMRNTNKTPESSSLIGPS